MLRIAIVEDELHYQNQLSEFLRRFELDRIEPIDITTYNDGDHFVENYKAQFDIILLDIQMPLLDGMSAAEEIRKIDSEVVIIFITNMAQYAIKGYSVDALDYVLKPISYFSFSERLNRAIERMNKRKPHNITIKIKGGLKKLKVSDIYFIESQGYKLIFYSKDGEYTTSGTMKELEEQLSEFPFFRSHKGYLLNLEHVVGMNENYAMINGHELPVSRIKRKSFMEALTKYWGDIIK